MLGQESWVRKVENLMKGEVLNMRFAYGREGEVAFKRFGVYWVMTHCPNCGKEKAWGETKSLKIIDHRYEAIEQTDSGKYIMDTLCVDCIKNNFEIIVLDEGLPEKWKRRNHGIEYCYGCGAERLDMKRMYMSSLGRMSTPRYMSENIWDLKMLHRIHNRYCILCGISLGSRRQKVCSKCNDDLRIKAVQRLAEEIPLIINFCLRCGRQIVRVVGTGQRKHRLCTRCKEV